MRHACAEHTDRSGSIDDAAQTELITRIRHWSEHGDEMVSLRERRIEDYPETRENWAEATSAGRAKCIIAVKSGHTLVSDEPAGFAGGAGGNNEGPTPSGLLASAFAADIPVMLQRIAGELGFPIAAIRARVCIEFSPRGIAGFPGYKPAPFRAVSDIWVDTDAPAVIVEEMKAQYLRRCPLYALFHNSGCEMVDRWHVSATTATAQ